MLTCFAEGNAGHTMSDARVLQKGYMEEEYSRENVLNFNYGWSKEGDGAYANTG